MKNPIGWFEIYVDDMARAQRFYETVLGIELSDLGDPSGAGTHLKAFPADMEQYGASGALIHMQGCPAGGNSVMVYFNCDDCAVEESRVEAAGGRVEKSKFAIGEYGFVSVAFDTEGNMIGLHSQQ